MLFLLDSNAVSDLLRAHPKALARLNSMDPANRVCTCPIVVGEILFGIERLAPGKRQQDLRSQAEAIFRIAPCDPIGESVAQRYASIKCALEKDGIGWSENDLWIAATSLDAKAVLVTRDRAFHRIKELVVEDWTS